MKEVIFTHCVFCGCALKPGEGSAQIENACFDCA
jgi:ribosomal protein L24E